MSKRPPNIRIRGIRQKIPSGYLIGRVDKGKGRAQLVSAASLRQVIGGSSGFGQAPTAIAERAEIGFFVAGALNDEELLVQALFTRDVDFPEDFAGSAGYADSPALLDAEFDVQKNGVSIGTITFEASSTAPIFDLSGGASFVADDVLRIIAPVTADFSLGDVTVLLIGEPV